MFFPIRFKTNIQIPISELHDDFNEILLNKLQNDFEGKCTRFGFIKPESIIIEKRSCGKFIKQHFNGYVSFEIISKAEACNPPKNTRIEAVVKNKNALGILAESVININGKDIPILDIIVPRRAAGIVSEIDLDDLNIGDKFNVMVMGKSYQLNDSKISIIGRGVNQLNVGKAGELNEVPDLVEGDAEENSEEENSEEEESENSDEEAEHSDDESETKVVGGLDLYEDDFLGGNENSEASEIEEAENEELSDEEEYVGGYDDYE